jgi:hypothetical protein
MRIENEAARRLYEIESASQQWSVRQLQRQVGSSLYERVGLSRDKDKVMALANKGQTIESPRDIFKTPYPHESGTQDNAGKHIVRKVFAQAFAGRNGVADPDSLHL